MRKSGSKLKNNLKLRKDYRLLCMLWEKSDKKLKEKNRMLLTSEKNNLNVRWEDKLRDGEGFKQNSKKL